MRDAIGVPGGSALYRERAQNSESLFCNAEHVLLSLTREAHTQIKLICTGRSGSSIGNKRNQAFHIVLYTLGAGLGPTNCRVNRRFICTLKNST
jgi:hypothetical protein